MIGKYLITLQGGSERCNTVLKNEGKDYIAGLFISYHIFHWGIMLMSILLTLIE